MTKRKDQSYRSNKCLNCNTPLDVSEKYCHYCGQLNSTKKITVSDFFEEFFSNFYAYDSRLRNTFFFLFSKPGFVAKQIINGKRQTFANPFRLFLSITILFFIVDNIQENSSTKASINSPSTKTENDTLFLSSKFHKDSIYTSKELFKDSISSINEYSYQITSFRNYNLKNPNHSSKEAFKILDYEDNRINRFLYNKAQSLKSNNLKREVGDYLISKLPFLIFISLPFITLIFWLVFYSKEHNYADHLVFTYTFYTFLFIILFINTLLNFISSSFSDIFLIVSFSILFPVYLYKSLRYFYENSRWITILKFVLLNLLFIPIITLTVSLILFIAILFF
ncbi:MAG: DUF3667 domain-containing protein [Flavobacterium sp.]|jgi:hypothetical protein